MVSCILLSAGLSQRFGSPKALAKISDTTVIEHLQKLLVNTQVSEIIVVLGAQADEIKSYLLKHKKVKFVYNKDYNFGQTSSFKAGLEAISKDAQGVMLVPVDYPLVRMETVDLLIKVFLKQRPLILIPTFKDKKGHPPLFAMSLYDEFLALDNEKGLNTIAYTHETQTTVVPVDDPGIIMTFNTPEEFEAIKHSQLP